MVCLVRGVYRNFTCSIGGFSEFVVVAIELWGLWSVHIFSGVSARVCKSRAASSSSSSLSLSLPTVNHLTEDADLISATAYICESPAPLSRLRHRIVQWITRATRAHGSFSMTLVVLSLWAYVLSRIKYPSFVICQADIFSRLLAAQYGTVSKV